MKDLISKEQLDPKFLRQKICKENKIQFRKIIKIQFFFGFKKYQMNKKKIHQRNFN